jgi:hypothetical protein
LKKRWVFIWISDKFSFEKAMSLHFNKAMSSHFKKRWVSISIKRWVLISKSDESPCQFKLTTTLRRHDNRSRFEWLWWDETQFEWILMKWDTNQKKKVVSRSLKLSAHANKHWCHWIRIRWWVSRTITLWSSEDRVCSIDKEATDKNLWWEKKSDYHSCHLLKNDHSKTY